VVDSWHSIRVGLRHPQAFPEFQARWRKEIVPRHDVVVAADGDVVVGFAAADVPARVLVQIFVDPGRKREGIGSQMLVWARTRMSGGFRLETPRREPGLTRLLRTPRPGYRRQGDQSRKRPADGVVLLEAGQERVKAPVFIEEATGAERRREATTPSRPPT
jgi:GNAT superfamily N-acetyltransferase